jgi:hypothetical protein
MGSPARPGKYSMYRPERTRRDRSRSRSRRGRQDSEAKHDELSGMFVVAGLSRFVFDNNHNNYNNNRDDGEQQWQCGAIGRGSGGEDRGGRPAGFVFGRPPPSD